MRKEILIIGITILMLSFAMGAPSVTPTAPGNSTIFITAASKISFNASITSSSTLVNATLNIWEINSSYVYSLTQPLSGLSANINVSFTNNNNTKEYVWNYLAVDTGNIPTYAPFNFTYFEWTLPTVTLKSPANSTFTINNTIMFNASIASTPGIGNSTFYLWDINGTLENTTFIQQNNYVTSQFGVSQTVNVSVNLPYNGSFYWNFQTQDSSNNTPVFASLNNSVYYNASGGLSACGITLNIPNEIYTVNKNVSGGTGTCFTVTATNITLDAKGYKITATAMLTSSQSNFTFKNDNPASNGTLTIGSNSLYTNFTGASLIMSNAQNNTILNANLSASSTAAITISGGSVNNTITNITASAGTRLFSLNTGLNNYFWNSTATGMTQTGAIFIVGASVNNTFTNINLSNSASDAINFFTANSEKNNSFINVTVTGTAAASRDLLMLAGINNTVITDGNFKNYSLSADSLFDIKSSSWGDALFSTLTGNGTNFTSNVNFANMSINITESISGFNHTANITFYNAPIFTSANITRDGQICQDCYNFTSLIGGGNIIFNISGSGNYTLNGTTSTPNSCTYTSGNWNVIGGDNCTITSNINLGGNNFTIAGPGTFILSGANITNFNYGMIRGGVSASIINGGRLW